MTETTAPSVEDRARLSRGSSQEAIYALVAEVVEGLGVAGGGLLDVGCGRGLLWSYHCDRLSRGCFAAFAEAPGLYPAHLTAPVETDLLHMAREQGLSDAHIRYSDRGRITLTPVALAATITRPAVQ